MSIPLPPTALEGDCAAIDNDTLYVLSQKAFQSLPIKQHGNWSQETAGSLVQGPACAAVIPDGDNSDAALWVIGGQSTDGGDSGALQRYFFGNKTWESLSPLSVGVLSGRTNHSAVYLNDSRSILVYAGSQPDAFSYYSSQTFLISTDPPYTIQSYTSHAPPSNLPILAPWNSSHAVMVGGSNTNTEVWTFSPNDGWNSFPTTLTNALDPSARAVIVDGSDGSKVLQVYTTNVSPNTVSGIVLLDANSQAAATGQTVGGGSSNSKKRKRDLTLQNWPSYNSSNAPTATRADSSIAQNADGLVVMAGGNDDVPVIMFDQTNNGWIDAGTFFDAPSQQPLQPTASKTNAASSTGSSSHKATSSSSSDTPTYGEPSSSVLSRDLGIVLGTLFAFVVALVIALCFFKAWHKRKRREQGYLDEKGDGNRMSFADRGASFMKEAGVSMTELGQPATDRFAPNHNNNSHSSLAIIAGRFGNKRNTNNHAQKSSYESTAHLVRDKNGQMVAEPVEMVDIGDHRVLHSKRSNSNKRGAPNRTAVPTVPELEGGASQTAADRKRSSGWSKYFATSQPTGPNGLSHLPSAYAKTNAQSMGSQYSTDHAKVARIPSTALVPPLDIDFNKTIDGQRLSHVASASPSFGDSREDLAKSRNAGGASAHNTNRKSQSASISSYGDRSTVGSTLTGDYFHDGSAESSWTPMTGSSFKDHVNSERPTSSIYTASIYDSSNRKYSRAGKSSGGFFPGAGTSYKPKSKGNHSAASSVANPKVPDLPRTENRESALSVFPKGIPSAYYQKGNAMPHGGVDTALPKPVNTDMSWLNLGLNRGQA